MMRAFVLLILTLILTPAMAVAREYVLTPDKEYWVVNLEDSTDVRLLFQFQLPASLTAQTLVSAALLLSGESPDSCLLKAGPLNGSWSDESSWGTLSDHLAKDPGFDTGIEGCEFGTPLESGEDTNFLHSVEFFVTDFVESWLTRTENYGLAVRAIRPNGTEACGRWGESTTASLRIVAYGSE
jgi:hypothetical protein